MIRTAVATARSSAPPMVAVPKLWPGGTVACIATGPSLTQADVDYVRDKVDGVIVVNDAFRLAPWAPILYACDAKWYGWNWKKGVSAFQGAKYALDLQAAKYPGVQVLCNTGQNGLELNPTGLRTGKNSGYQAVNLAVHLGAAKVVLLGYDFRGDHYFGSHPDKSRPPFQLCLRLFDSTVEPLHILGIRVVNCSPHTALTAFPRVALREALP